jgi:hypothetical protein
VLPSLDGNSNSETSSIPIVRGIVWTPSTWLHGYWLIDDIKLTLVASRALTGHSDALLPFILPGLAFQILNLFLADVRWAMSTPALFSTYPSELAAFDEVTFSALVFSVMVMFLKRSTYTIRVGPDSCGWTKEVLKLSKDNSTR